MKRKTSEEFIDAVTIHKDAYDNISVFDIYQPQLRKLVFECDDWTCQKCGSIDTLHCHHIDPVINNPIESADVDNCITYCVECHKEAHQQDGCTLGELKEC